MMPVRASDLGSALRLGPHELVAFVGGGGKTTLAHMLAARLGGRRVLTTTTRMGSDQSQGIRTLIAPTDAEIAAITEAAPVLVWERVDAHKAIGVTPEACDRWFGLVDHVIVEADGARRMPFKAPDVNEPVVPAHTTVLVSVIGADAIGRTIADATHRPLRVAELAGCTPSDPLSVERVAAVLVHPDGMRRAQPPGARFVVVVTKVLESNRAIVGELLAEIASRDRALETLAVAFENLEA